MPPANSPSFPHGSEPRSPSSPPLPSYAANLSYALHTSQASDEVDEENVSFLRDSLDSLDEGVVSDRRSRSQADLDPRTASDRSTRARNSNSDHLDDLSRRDRLQRVLARLNRIHDPPGPSSVASAYGNRTPSPTRQRLYDWAPSQAESAQDESDLDQILVELRRQQPDTHSDLLRVLSQSQYESSRQRPRDSTYLAEAADRRDRLRERRRRDNEWASRRAVLQRVGQESSPSATERMLRYVMDRERSGLSEEEERARGTGWFNPPSAGRSSNEQHRNRNTAREPWPLPPASDIPARTPLERAEPLQRRYVAEGASSRQSRMSTPPLPSSSSPRFLENALKYLNELRSCFQYEDALSAAIDNNLATKEFFADKHDDFVMDLEEVDPIAMSSWLQTGAKFEGHQHATSSTSGLLQTRQNNSVAHTTEQINPHYRNQGTTTAGLGFDHPPGSTRVQPFDATRPWLSHQFTPPILNALSPLTMKSIDPSNDHWPVRVTIHSIDAERMTLQGTMEAYDVPQHSTSISAMNPSERPKAGKKNAPITTYLEGHIIDLSTHSFLTPMTSAAEIKRQGPQSSNTHDQTPYTTSMDAISFPSADPHIDASNWRKLPPFNSLPSDEETARCLLSKARMSEVYSEYIFMRWKERCFVHSKDDECSEEERSGDQDRGHGLTISGFYYVSLRRSDGLVEGLYFDPTSTPYQRLRLEGHRSGWPAVELK